MADINIERKSGAGSVVPWIIGLLVLALVAWWLLAGRGDDRRAQEDRYLDTTAAPAAGMPAPATTADPAYDDPATLDGTPAADGTAAEPGMEGTSTPGMESGAEVGTGTETTAPTTP